MMALMMVPMGGAVYFNAHAASQDLPNWVVWLVFCSAGVGLATALVLSWLVFWSTRS